MARPPKGPKKKVMVRVFLPPVALKAIDEKIPEFARTRSEVVRMVVLNWAQEGWVLKRGED